MDRKLLVFVQKGSNGIYTSRPSFSLKSDLTCQKYIGNAESILPVVFGLHFNICFLFIVLSSQK